MLHLSSQMTGSLHMTLSEAWGITYEACNSICKPRGGWKEFGSTYFSVSVTSWVLPWLARTAQFPYDTKDTATNLRSLLLAFGCPMIATYSLSLTVLSSRWINIRFFRLRDQNRNMLGENRSRQLKPLEFFSEGATTYPLESVTPEAQLLS